MQTNTRDFGLPSNGKGSVPRTDINSPGYQLAMEQIEGIGNSARRDQTFRQVSPGRFRKKF